MSHKLSPYISICDLNSVKSWVGWVGTDAEFIIDLGEEKTVSSIETDFLHQLGAWILLPEKVNYSVSLDNETYTHLGSFKFEEDRDLAVKFKGGKVTGVGDPAWFFIDEVVVL